MCDKDGLLRSSVFVLFITMHIAKKKPPPFGEGKPKL